MVEAGWLLHFEQYGQKRPLPKTGEEEDFYSCLDYALSASIDLGTTVDCDEWVKEGGGDTGWGKGSVVVLARGAGSNTKTFPQLLKAQNQTLEELEGKHFGWVEHTERAPSFKQMDKVFRTRTKL